MDFDFDDDYFEDDIEDDYDEFDSFELEKDLTETTSANDEAPEEDNFDVEDAIWLGGAMGWAYEEGLNERRYMKKSKGSIPDKKKKT